LAKGEIGDLLRKHGGKTGEELKAEGKWNAESSLPDQAKLKKKNLRIMAQS
jgi:hypothetical protein